MAPHPTNRCTDNSLIAKAANDAMVTLAYRLAVFIVLGLMMFVGTRFVAQLDSNTTALTVINVQMGVTVSVLDGIVRRVEGLENRERGR